MFRTGRDISTSVRGPLGRGVRETILATARAIVRDFPGAALLDLDD